MDLFYRLNVVPLRVPPLRERLEDVAPLAVKFLGDMAERAGRAPQTVDEEGLALLRSLEWPGNVRQLKNLLEGAAVFLASAASNFVNGQIIYVDGGILATIGKPSGE